RAASERALDADIAAERSRQIAADREAQARALRPARERAPDLNEGLEDALELIRRDTYARVPNGQFHMISRRAIAGEDDLAAGQRELHGVREEIEENLLNLAAIRP